MLWPFVLVVGEEPRPNVAVISYIDCFFQTVEMSLIRSAQGIMRQQLQVCISPFRFFPSRMKDDGSSVEVRTAKQKKRHKMKHRMINFDFDKRRRLIPLLKSIFRRNEIYMIRSHYPSI